ncbi:tRNA (adenosine(37)-N6)-dimethylallyltransferase MiaA [bacterium]|nr:tRNA (adenosine(37)-N6)-dimethylallyltransferase MiaA [bacterium]
MSSFVIVLAGPTCIGKSKVAVSLSTFFSSEIVSADSMQVYKYMNIGTAKPSREDRRAVLHHMIDIVYPDQYFSAGEYAKMARDKIDEILDSGKTPIVVGGSGLYIRALIDGLFPEPIVSESIKKRIRTQLDDKGPHYLYKKLEKVDPTAASKIHQNDWRRIIRALDVFLSTGETISSLQSKAKAESTDYQYLMIGLKTERSNLYKRIESRVDSMFEKGLTKEVRQLAKRGYGKDFLPMQSLGYKEVFGYISGDYSLSEAKTLLKKNTRHFAKRQMTWFNKDTRIKWIETSDVDKEIDSICHKILRLAGL